MLNDLIKRCINNESSAQHKLYEKYKQAWFMTCLRYAPKRVDADDFFQDGVINIFNNIAQFDESKASFATWSNRIMVNSALIFLRKWKHHLNYISTDLIDIDESTQEDVNDYLSAQELVKMIQKLPNGYRVVFKLYVMAGYKNREIAFFLNISVKTSKIQLRKAKLMLRNELELIFENEYK